MGPDQDGDRSGTLAFLNYSHCKSAGAHHCRIADETAAYVLRLEIPGDAGAGIWGSGLELLD